MQKEQRDRKETEKSRVTEKAASFWGAVRDSVPEEELSGGGARHSEAESAHPRPRAALMRQKFHSDAGNKLQREGGFY